MENLHKLLLERHSIRRYTDQALSPEDVTTILQAALLAPSSKSARPWQFVVVEDPEVLSRLAQCKPAAAMPIAKCKMAVVVAADPAKSDCYIEDASIAAQLMQLQAADLGIGSCWIQVLNRYSADGNPAQELIQRELNMPLDLPIICVMTFGYPDEQRRPVDPEKLLWEKVHIGTYRNDE